MQKIGLYLIISAFVLIILVMLSPNVPAVHLLFERRWDIMALVLYWSGLLTMTALTVGCVLILTSLREKKEHSVQKIGLELIISALIFSVLAGFLTYLPVVRTLTGSKQSEWLFWASSVVPMILIVLGCIVMLFGFIKHRIGKG